MEFSVKKFDLLEELQYTQGVVERKTTIPILSNLLVEAKGNRLTITATDLELSIRTSCEAKIKKEGAGTIPAKKLLELVKLLPEEEIKFKLLDNHWVHITCDRRNYKLVGMSKENFPALPNFPHAMVKVPAALLASVPERTVSTNVLGEGPGFSRLHPGPNGPFVLTAPAPGAFLCRRRPVERHRLTGRAMQPAPINSSFTMLALSLGCH